MERKKILLLNVLLSVIIFGGYAQKSFPLSESLLNAILTNASDRYGITYELPDRFTNLMIYEHFYIRHDNPKGSSFLYGPILQSTDKECIVMYPTSPYPLHYTKEDIEGVRTAYYFNKILQGCDSINKEFVPPSYINMNRKRIKGELMGALQIPHKNKDQFDFDEHTSVISGKIAQDMFNADSLFFYEIPLDVPYQDVYNHCLGMIVSKKDRASLFYKWLFTDDGKKKQKEYISLLNKAIWYNDGDTKRKEE